MFKLRPYEASIYPIGRGKFHLYSKLELNNVSGNFEQHELLLLLLLLLFKLTLSIQRKFERANNIARSQTRSCN